MSRFLRLALAAALLTPTAAFAHTGVGATHGLAHGFVHPIGGIDHVLAMVTVGILAWQLGGRALWLVPASFVGVMAMGGVIGSSGIVMPFVEVGIALSVVVMGLLVALTIRTPVAAAMGLVAFFAIFHGYAHGAEMPGNAASFTYGAGFVAATALLHAAGIGLGAAIGWLGPVAVRLTGGAFAFAGIVTLVGVV